MYTLFPYTTLFRSRVQRAAGLGAEALAHDRQGLRRRQHGAVAGACVVAMTVRNDRAADRAVRIDSEVARLAIEAARGYLEPGFGFHGWQDRKSTRLNSSH